ncbi:hypothetical protein ABZ907_39935 [Nonomuraea wenchangensis]
MTYPYMGEYAESLIAKGEANAIFLIFEGRGIPVSDEVRSQVLACTDKDTLDAWVLRALTIETAEALFDA